MIRALKTKQLTIEKAELTILKALAYFDIFDYPLSQQEIKNFLGSRMSETQFRQAFQRLFFSKTIFKVGEYYSLRNDPDIAERRTEGNVRANKLLPRAAAIGAFLYRFPYVRGVAVSGSLSKNYADEKADIDFFIITKTNRLWIARTLLHLFKKLTFLYGRQHFYCMNYFIDEKSMSLQDQNIYSAMEVVTLLPVAGKGIMNKFFGSNEWTEEWLPAYVTENELTISDRSSALKKIVERVLDRKMGDRIDDIFFKWTSRRWQKKEQSGRRNTKGKIMNLVTGKHFSKSDPGAFQSKIVALHEYKVEQLRNRWPQYFD